MKDIGDGHISIGKDSILFYRSRRPPCSLLIKIVASIHWPEKKTEVFGPQCNIELKAVQVP
jgi:hypothetical protein